MFGELTISVGVGVGCCCGPGCGTLGCKRWRPCGVGHVGTLLSGWDDDDRLKWYCTLLFPMRLFSADAWR